MKCQFCDTEIKEWDQSKKSHLIVTKDVKNHFHTHGDFDNKQVMKEMIEAASLEANITKNIDQLDHKEAVFHNKQRIGDILMFTAGIRDLKAAYPDLRINVISTAAHIWDNNPNIDRTLIPTQENTIKIGPSKLTNASNRLDWHFANAYRMSIEDALNIHIPQGESRPDIYLTEEEYNAERVIKEPYWIIITSGEKSWGSKMYPFDRWEEFIKQNPDKLFVQLGAREDNVPRLVGSNVIDMVGKTQDRDTGIRDLFKLFLNAEGSIGLVSFHMHLSGALYKPAVIIAGAREPVSFTRYQGHRYLATDGCLPCAATTACWHCDIDTCTDLVKETNRPITPRCVEMIKPIDITNAINQYYIGGRLKLNEVSKKPKLKNIVKNPINIAVSKEIKDNEKSKYDIAFGGTSITKEDFEFLQSTIKENNVKTILEFGSGLSTLLLSDIVKITSYETDENIINKFKSIKSDLDIRLWDGKELLNIENKRYDLAFVDGPSGGASRENATSIASELSDIVIIHDASREHELKWQEKYLKNKFFGPGGGGKRCHLWSKNKDVKISLRTGSPVYSKDFNSQKEINYAESHNVDLHNNIKDKKFIKFVSTARGWGGCARSCTTLMKMLLKEGHKVEFIPFRNKVSSKEYQQYIKDNLQDLIVTENYDTIKEKCDILFIYADDFVWEIGKNKEIDDYFSNINADKKIMMLNYRQGLVGQVEWTKKFDKFMFLNSIQEKELLKVLPNVKTKVLAPCTELDEFLKIQPNYNNNIRIVRHSSQGDTKFSKNFKEELDVILDIRKDIEIHMLPGPSFINENDRIKKYPCTADKKVIAEFLSMGNLFVYSLPEKYLDMGPRVILESMAAGLPVIADNWGGAVDRITPETGWLCSDKKQYIDIIKNLTFEELEKKGKAARQRAIEEFIPEKWIKEIVE